MGFTLKVSWWKTGQHLESKEKKALPSLLMLYFWDLGDFEPVKRTENVQLSFRKNLLSISTSVSNEVLLGDLE